MKTVIRILALALIFTLSTHAQNTVVDYETNNNGDLFTSELIMSDSVSIWKYKANQKQDVPGMDEVFIVKDYRQEMIFFNDAIFNVKFFVKDSMYNIHWKITENHKTILEQDCISATASFRGRTYVAYFTPDIENPDGPWKFAGLPGLILEVASEDMRYRHVAVKISKNLPAKIETTRLKNNEFISWELFTTKFKTVVDNYIKMLQTNGSVAEGSEVNIKITGPEIIYSKIQEGTGVKF